MNSSNESNKKYMDRKDKVANIDRDLQLRNKTINMAKTYLMKVQI